MKRPLKSLLLVLSSSCAFSVLFIAPSAYKQLLILPPLWLLFPSHLFEACPVLCTGILVLIAAYFGGIRRVHQDLDFGGLISVCVHVLFLLDLESTPAIPLGHGATLRCKRGIPSSLCFPNLGLGSLHVLGLAALSLAVTRLNVQKLCLSLDGASVTVYALLVISGVSVPPDPSFLLVRLSVVGFQLLVDLATAASAGWTVAAQQLESLAIGAAYVMFMTPSIGDFPVVPYLWPCESDSRCFVGNLSVSLVRLCIIVVAGLIAVRKIANRRRAQMLDFAIGYKTLRSVLSTPDTTDVEDDSPMSAQDVL